MLECGDEEEGLFKEKEEVGLFETTAMNEVGSRRKRGDKEGFFKVCVCLCMCVSMCVRMPHTRGIMSHHRYSPKEGRKV